MNNNPSKGDIFFAFLLVAIACFGIIKFLVIPYSNERRTEPDPSVETSVTDIVSASVSEETSVSESTEASPEISEEVSVEVVIPPEIPIPEEKKKKIVWEKIEHPTLEDCDIVLIGDSIFATGSDEEPSTAIADLLEEISGARIYNMAMPGMRAITSEDEAFNQQEAVRAFLDLEQTKKKALLFNSELGRFANDDHSGRQLVVIMNCAINDYFMNSEMEGNAYDGETYFGAITNCINWIKGENEYAIVCYLRNHCVVHGTYGYDFNSAGATYNMYKNTMIEACEYEGAMCITCDSDDGINYDNAKALTEDGTHLNLEGRKIEARLIKEYLEELLTYY